VCVSFGMTQPEHMCACAALDLACDNFCQQKMAQRAKAHEGQCVVVVLARNAYCSLAKMYMVVKDMIVSW
jgi:hypothetical protein